MFVKGKQKMLLQLCDIKVGSSRVFQHMRLLSWRKSKRVYCFSSGISILQLNSPGITFYKELVWNYIVQCIGNFLKLIFNFRIGLKVGHNECNFNSSQYHGHKLIGFVDHSVVFTYRLINGKCYASRRSSLETFSGWYIHCKNPGSSICSVANVSTSSIIS